MPFESFFRRESQGFFDEGHVETIFARRPPRRTSVRRANVASIELFDKPVVEHVASVPRSVGESNALYRPPVAPGTSVRLGRGSVKGKASRFSPGLTPSPQSCVSPSLHRGDCGLCSSPRGANPRRAPRSSRSSLHPSWRKRADWPDNRAPTLRAQKRVISAGAVKWWSRVWRMRRGLFMAAEPVGTWRAASRSHAGVADQPGPVWQRVAPRNRLGRDGPRTGHESEVVRLPKLVHHFNRVSTDCG